MVSSAFGTDFEHRLAEESGSLYALGIFIVAVRLYARIKKLSIRGLEWDDYLMLLALVWYTLLIVTLNLTAAGAGSALAMPGEDVFALPEDEVKARELGAKIDLVAEQAMLNVIWTLKACMLLLYSRLTQGLKGRVAVKVLAVYSALGYVAIQLAYFSQCRPFAKYWQIAPSPNLNCMTLWAYAIVQGTFNISSDIAMLMIPFPLVLNTSIPFRQKVVLLLVFSMGAFVVAAAILTKVNFFVDVYSADYMFWYFREASVAVYVANLPCIWPLLKELMPVLRSWGPGGSSNQTSKRGPTTMGANGTMTAGTRKAGTAANRSQFMVSRRSMEEFDRIARPTDAGEDKKGFGQTEVELEKGLRTPSRDSDEKDPGLGGIRAETTIEMHSIERDEIALLDDKASF